MAESKRNRKTGGKGGGRGARPDEPRKAGGANHYGLFAQPVLENLDEARENLAYIRGRYPNLLPDLGAIRIQPADAAARLSDDAIRKAVDQAMEQLPALLAGERGKKLPASELAKLRGPTEAWLRRLGEQGPDVAAARESARTGLKFSVAGGYFVAAFNGRADTIIASRDDDFADVVAAHIIFADIAFEILGLVLGLVGVRIPKPDGAKMAGSMGDLIKSKGFKRALAELLDGLDNGDPLAILTFLNYLRAAGVLGEMAAAWLADLDWFDYTAALLRLLAFLAAGTATGGTTVWVQIAVALAGLAELYLKFKEARAIF